MLYLGFHEERELPYSSGACVSIPRGTKYKTSRPGVDFLVARKTFTIKIHHILNGWDCHIGYYNDRSGFVEALWSGDLRIIEKIYGTKDYRSLWPIMKIVPLYNETKTVMLPMSNPQICWSGSGGYWHQVDINDLMLANK